MTLRIEYRKVAPDAVTALSAVNRYIAASSIAPRLRHLLEVRVSQINGCSYCIQVHRRQALAAGESETRLGALEAWPVSTVFSDRERAALTWTEDVTKIAETAAPDDSFAALTAHFSEKEIVDLTFVVISMNAWNRLAIAFKREAPGHDG